MNRNAIDDGIRTREVDVFKNTSMMRLFSAVFPPRDFNCTSSVFRLTVDGKTVVMSVTAGDKVITDKYAGTKVTLEDVEYIIVKQGDILAIVE